MWRKLNFKIFYLIAMIKIIMLIKQFIKKKFLIKKIFKIEKKAFIYYFLKNFYSKIFCYFNFINYKKNFLIIF